jgi:membrane protein required for beta-lactamase induction
MERLFYFLFATSFAATAANGLAMLVAPAPWIALQKRLITYIAPPQQAESFIRMIEAIPIRIAGAVYLLVGSVALYLIWGGVVTFPMH